jgi:hypothetical protein
VVSDLVLVVVVDKVFDLASDLAFGPDISDKVLVVGMAFGLGIADMQDS